MGQTSEGKHFVTINGRSCSKCLLQIDPKTVVEGDGNDDELKFNLQKAHLCPQCDNIDLQYLYKMLSESAIIIKKNMPK
jgi:hypothetical protein